jgi:uncharacterized protein YjdB
MIKKLIVGLSLTALTFVGLTAITGPTQQANATAQTDYYDTIAARWNTDNPVKVNFCGYNWIVVGINDGTNNVGIGTQDGSLVNDNTTLLFASDNGPVFGFQRFGATTAYDGSNLQSFTNTTIYENFSSCSTRADITQRTLIGGGDDQDHITGSDAENQFLWPISYTEATMLTNEERWFHLYWWLRTPCGNGRVADVNGYTVNCAPGAEINRGTGDYVRPALYLKLSSAVFSQLPDLTTQYLTHFDLKGGDGTLGDEYITVDSPTALPVYNGTKPGFVFKGWSTSSDATTTNYGNGATVSNITTVGATATLYAVWKAQVSGMSIDPTNTTVTVGQTANLSATITAEPTFENITWSSSDNSLATVNSTGTVTTSNVGDVTITAKSVIDETKYATTIVHIVQQPEIAPTLALDYTNETVTGFDNDTTGFRIASIEAGLTGASCEELATGTSDIASTITNSSKTLWTKKCATDGNHSDSTTTSIVIPARPVAPTISATAPSLYGLGDGFVGGLTTNEEWNATSATYDGAWTPVTGTSVDNLSAGDKVCVRTVAEAGVKFKSLGSCVTVGQGIAPVNSVSVTPTAVTLTAGQTKQLSVTVLPVYADDKSVVWSSSNNSVATVSSSGKVTAKSAGTVTIKATAQDGSGVVGKSVITVKPKPVSTKAKKAKGSITFIWGASGFLTTVEIYYKIKGSSKWKIVRVSGADRKKIKLKRKKTYQFQLRSCKTVKGKNYYSAWTKKTIKS